MKELSIEEKANAYDDALERARAINSGKDVDVKAGTTACEYIFPELKESEDERIRKWLIAQLQIKIGDNATLNNMIYKAIAWLEKQGSQKLANSAKTCKDEQKPTDEEMKEVLRTEYEKGRAEVITEMQNHAWSEEDMSKVQRICKYLNEAKKYYADTTEVRDCMDWLKSLEDRVQPQPKQEWSEEDERMFEQILQQFMTANNKCKSHNASFTYDKEISFIKSLKGRVHPK